MARRLAALLCVMVVGLVTACAAAPQREFDYFYLVRCCARLKPFMGAPAHCGTWG